jgi:hypothetical protein
MQRTININGRECAFKSSGALPRIYRNQFGRDIFQDVVQLEGINKDTVYETGTMEILENIFYAMAKHADDTVPPIEEWLEGFETFDLIAATKDILEIWKADIKTKSRAKKKSSQSTEK